MKKSITNLQQFYLQTSQFTDLGRYKDEAIDLWQNKCKGSLKLLCRYLMNVTVHPVVMQWATEGRAQLVEPYGNFDFINYTTPIREDDIFLTATSMFAEILRRDSMGFYIGRPVESRLKVSCRYVSVLVCAILKANGIPCRSRAGWATYLSPKKALDHWVNEYWDAKQAKWIKIDLDDLYDPEDMPDADYKRNGIAKYYLNLQPKHFITASEAWQSYRSGQNIVGKLQYGSNPATPEHILKYLFLDLFAVMQYEVNYTFMPIAFNKKVEDLTQKQLKFADDLASLLQDVDGNWQKLYKLWQTEPKVRLVASPLVGADNYQALIDDKKYKL